MADTISRTAFGDAPLASAKHPDPNASFDLPPVEAREPHELVGRSVTVARPRDELYHFWREFGNLERFLLIVRSVKSADAVRAHRDRNTCRSGCR